MSFFRIFLLVTLLSLPTMATELEPFDLNSLMTSLQTRKDAVSTKNVEPISSEKTVEKITVKGVSDALKNLVDNEITLKIGDPASAIKINRNIKNIQGLGLFKDVSYDLVEYKAGQELVITLKENPKVTSIEFNGLSLYDPEELKAIIKTKEEDTLNVRLLRDDIKALESRYKEDSYGLVKIYSVQSPTDEDGPLTFFISEGIIQGVFVTGNNHTKDYVILREMDTEPGRPLNNKILNEDLRRVFNLNYFTGLNPTFPSGTSPNTKLMVLEVTEKDTNAQLSFGGSYSPTGGGAIFTNLYWDNLWGTGKTILINSQLGIESSNAGSTYQIKYVDPWAFGKRKSFTFKTWLTDGNVSAINPLAGNNSVGFRNERSNGVELGIGWPYSYDIRSQHALKVEKVQLFQDEGAFVSEDKSYSVISYQVGFSIDKRDVWVNPLNGYYHNITYEKGFDILRSTLNFWKLDLNLRNYTQVTEKSTFATRVSLGVIYSSRMKDELDLFSREIYWVGGSSTVRGWNDLDPFAKGNKRALGTIEYRYNFNQIFQGILFVDAGHATYSHDFSIDNFRIGKGLGIRFQVPALGPIRLDYGINDLGVGYIHFNIGHSF